MPLMPADKLLPKLNKVKKGKAGAWTACCPAHNDKSPSLRITEAADGVLLLKCWTGCSAAEIVAAVGLELRDLFRITDDEKPTDPLEAELLRLRNEQAKRQWEAEQQRQHESAADYAKRLWSESRTADPDHPYLVSKGIKPHTLRQSGDVLLVPLFYCGQLVNLQRIWPDGSKRFLKGGMVKGCYSPIGSIELGQPLYFCEGLATGATIHEETGNAVACAMNCSNLLEVGQSLQRRHPDAVLIVAGDDDRQTEGNPGKTAAIKAAAALGCGLVLPPFPDNAPLTLSDFNDLRQWQREVTQ